MRNLIILIGIAILVSVSPALSADKLLKDHQLDVITAGTGGDGAQASIDAAAYNSVDYLSAQDGADFGGNSADNVVNAPGVRVDNSVDISQNVNSKNRKLILKDYAQEHVRAVSIINNMEGKVGIGVNAHYTSGGSISSLYQTNVVTNSN